MKAQPWFWRGRSRVSPANRGLNLMFRGGGKGGGAKVTERRRLEAAEAKLLETMEKVVSSYQEVAQSATPLPADQQEAGLVVAVQRALERSRRQPGTLLQRLVSLVNAAKLGKGFGKRKRGRPPDDVAEAPAKAPTRRRAKNDPPAAPTPAETWAQKVSKGVSQKGEAGKTGAKGSKRNVKGKGKGTTAPNARPSTFELLPAAWKPTERATYGEAKATLDKGAAVKAIVVSCQSIEQVRDLQRLAKLHGITDTPVV